MSAMLGGVAKLLESISRKKLATPKESGANERHARQILHPSGLSMPELNPRRFRVVVFRDEKGIKQQIFDSQQISTSEGEEPCTRSLCDMRCDERLESSLLLSSGGVNNPSCHSAGWSSQSTGTTRRGFFVKRPSNDSELLGEMMFGSMPMKVVGDTIKIHYTRSTDQLMLSKVFTCQRRPMAQCSITDFSESCPLPNYSPLGGGAGGGRSSERSFSYGNKGRHVSPDASRLPSSTLSVPIQSSQRTNSLSVSPHHLSVSSSHSPPSPLSSATTTPSLTSSFTRRIQRSRSTSLENASEVYRKVLKPMDQNSNITTRKRRKYAIGFIICLNELSKTDIRHFKSFIFSHFTLIDAHLEKLRLGVEDASNGRGLVMVDAITKAYETFLQDFLSLYRTPRIESPVWLSLVSCVDRRKETCLQFMEEFASAIVEMDTKETKFFLSSLLTAVLSHHLAWIFTVSYQHSVDYGRHGKHSSKSLGVLAESHPYNPLWAQLGDLLGSVTNPLKLSRTIVVGQSSFAISRLLYILTYFIRCSEVEPGFPEVGLSPPPAIPIATDDNNNNNRTQEVKIPPPSSPSSSSSYMGADSSSYGTTTTHQEHEVFGCSRASSITIMSEHDILSPYASPVNHGSDTPIVRTHPFGIKTTSVGHSQVYSSDVTRKGSQGESDSLNGFHIRGGGGQESGLRSGRKFSSLNRSGIDLSTSQKHSPLLSFSKDLEREGGDHMISSEGHVTSGDNLVMSCGGDVVDDERAHHCQPAAMATECHYGNSNTCATVASCESMGLCPVENGFLTFDPGRKHQPDNRHSCPGATSGADGGDFSSISHLATCGLLGPSPGSGPSPHSPDSALSVIPTHTSCSSLDSGYDHSWSLTNSSREDSCPEFPSSLLTMGGFNRNMASLPSVPAPPGGQFNRVCPSSGGDNCEVDSGRGSQCSIFLVQKGGVGGRGHDGKGVVSGSDSASLSSLVREDHVIPLRSSNVGAVSTSLKSSSLSLGPIQDHPRTLEGDATLINRGCHSNEGGHTSLSMTVTSPTSSLFPTKLTNYIQQHQGGGTVANSNTSPTSPLAEGERQLMLDNCSPPPRIEDFSISSDPLKPLPVRKLKNHHNKKSLNTPGNADIGSITPLDGGGSGEDNAGGGAIEGHSAPVQNQGLSGINSVPSNDQVPDRISSISSLYFNYDSLNLSNGSVVAPPPYMASHSEGNTGCGIESSDDVCNSLSEVSMCYNEKLHPSGSKPHPLSPTSELRKMLTLNSSSTNLPSEEAWSRESPCADCQHDTNTCKDHTPISRTDINDSREAGLRPLPIDPSSSSASVLRQQLDAHDRSLSMGMRPSTLERFDNFTDVPFPDLEDYHLDMHTLGRSPDVHYQKISDFGHSLFVGVSPRYLPDFVLHGTTERADQAFQDKIIKDIAHSVKHSIVDEPVDHGVGIVADTDSWSVKVLAASKSPQTSDVVYSTTTLQPAKSVRQMLSSVKSMHAMRMPSEFCLSYVEDSLKALNEQSIMLAEALVEEGGDVELTEVLPRVAESLSIDPSDCTMLLALAAVNCCDPDMAYRLNYEHMQHSMGRGFI